MFRFSKLLVFQRYFSSLINTRSFSNDGGSSGLKIALLGAGGRIGQPLALMLKNSPLFDELALYDYVQTLPLATELSHIDTRCRVTSHKGKIKQALVDARIVVIVASKPCKSLEYNVLFNENASVIFELVALCAKHCPKALIAIATQPVNSLVPLAAETLKRFNVYDPNKVFGITTPDVMRANVEVARLLGLPPEKVHVPVIGGHSDKTIVPILSQATPSKVFTNEELLNITEVVQAGSCLDYNDFNKLSLSAAYAVARFCVSLARGLKNESSIIECAYVHACLYPNIDYIATPVELGIGGVQNNLGIPKLTDYEDCLLYNASALLKGDIQMGESYVTGKKHIKKSFKESTDCTANMNIKNN